MDNCIVCLDSSPDTFSRISTQSSEWIEGNIQHVIEKHLWWWYYRKPKDSNDAAHQWICRQCWQEISSFHNFFIKVEREHKLLNGLNISILEKVKGEDELDDVKEEEQKSVDNKSTLIENLMPLEKPKRGRKKKVESIKIEELPTTEIKSEDDSLSVDNLHEPKVEGSSDREINDFNATDSFDDIWEPDVNISGGDDDDDTNDEKDNICPISENVANDDVLSEKKSEPRRKRKYNKSPSKKKKEIGVKKQKVDVPEVMTRKVKMSRENDKFLAESKFELKCSLCNAPLDSFQLLKIHYRKNHDIAGYVMCCNRKWYKRGMLVDHLRVHKDPNYFKCPHCEKTLANRTNYDNHLEYHKELNGPRVLSFPCEKCNKSFSKKTGYIRHQLLHLPEEEKKFECSECNKKFAGKNLLKQHIDHTHKRKYCKICDICGKLFRDKFTFDRHVDEHNGAPPPKVPCTICGVELTNKYLLNRHIKKLHTEEGLQEQICPYCSKVSPTLSAHRHHVQYAHRLERKHACHLCDKKFRRPMELKEHISVHTGEPLYNCPYCTRTFISSGNLHKHRKLSHRQEWEEARLKRLAIQQEREQKTKKHLNISCSDTGEAASLQQPSYPEDLTAVNVNMLDF